MPISSADVGTEGYPVVAVGAVIVHQNKVLLVKHVPQKAGFWAGTWICPGGRLQFGETLRAAAKREVLEETGLEIEIKGEPIVFERIVKDAAEDTMLHVIYVDFISSPRDSITPHPSSDVGEARWFRFEAIPWDTLHEDTVILLERSLGLIP
ncbi:MAG: NUDIX hydrolase [Candidatus Hodarchaeales archaeon]